MRGKFTYSALHGELTISQDGLREDSEKLFFSEWRVNYITFFIQAEITTHLENKFLLNKYYPHRFEFVDSNAAPFSVPCLKKFRKLLTHSFERFELFLAWSMFQRAKDVVVAWREVWAVRRYSRCFRCSQDMPLSFQTAYLPLWSLVLSSRKIAEIRRIQINIGINCLVILYNLPKYRSTLVPSHTPHCFICSEAYFLRSPLPMTLVIHKQYPVFVNVTRCLKKGDGELCEAILS